MKIEIGKEEDYDNFCSINKTNEKRRALSKFYTFLNKKDVLSNDNISDIVSKLLNLVEEQVDKDNSKNVIEEIFENVVIIINNLSETLLEDEKLIDDLKDMYEVISTNNISKKIEFKMLNFFESNDIEVDE